MNELNHKKVEGEKFVNKFLHFEELKCFDKK